MITGPFGQDQRRRLTKCSLGHLHPWLPQLTDGQACQTINMLAKRSDLMAREPLAPGIAVMMAWAVLA
jgi:hypothetical protein